MSKKNLTRLQEFCYVQERSCQILDLHDLRRSCTILFKSVKRVLERSSKVLTKSCKVVLARSCKILDAKSDYNLAKILTR